MHRHWHGGNVAFAHASKDKKCVLLVVVDVIFLLLLLLLFLLLLLLRLIISMHLPSVPYAKELFSKN